jgi:hypothetical protein
MVLVAGREVGTTGFGLMSKSHNVNAFLHFHQFKGEHNLTLD